MNKNNHQRINILKICTSYPWKFTKETTSRPDCLFK